MVTAEVDIKKMAEIIREIKDKVHHLKDISGGMQCVERNCHRMLASIKMLELNICDVADILE